MELDQDNVSVGEQSPETQTVSPEGRYIEWQDEDQTEDDGPILRGLSRLGRRAWETFSRSPAIRKMHLVISSLLVLFSFLSMVVSISAVATETTGSIVTTMVLNGMVFMCVGIMLLLGCCTPRDTLSFHPHPGSDGGILNGHLHAMQMTDTEMTDDEEESVGGEGG